MESNKMLEDNKRYYGELYARQESFLRYPADWIIRFHNLYLKKHLPRGRVLDYGCGTANNSIFFIENGYDVYGVDVTETVLELIQKNLEDRRLDLKLLDKFSIIPADCIRLPFSDNFFDLVVSNQVLYYLASENQIKTVVRELTRLLRPGGIVFFTMMGPENDHIKYFSKQTSSEGVYEMVINDAEHHLFGNRALIYLVRDEDHLKGLFSEFECLTTGQIDQAMFELKSNFHWIFVGRKRSA